eukprot:8688835-Ditylum_brightwellii.AAC.1
MRSGAQSSMHNLQLSAVKNRGERKGTYMCVSWSLAGLLRGNLVVWGVRGTYCTYEKGYRR